MIGVPFESDASGGDNARLTLWEQIDQGAQYTPTRKFLTLFPIGLFLMSFGKGDSHSDVSGNGMHSSEGNDFRIVCINLALLLTNLVAKLPMMHRVRLFGINKR